MAFKEKALSVFRKIKGEGRLWWFKENVEDPKMIMVDVVISLLPACIFGCILFDFNAVLVLLTSCISAVGAEFLWNLIFKKPQTVKDLSALVTGLLFGMCMPDKTPLWLVLLGSVFAIIVVKQVLGGIGYNLTNPAVTSVVLMTFIFPKIMTDFHSPFSSSTVALQNISFADLFFGLHSGGIGETSSFLLIVGGVYLIIRKIISPIVPLTFIGINALLCLIFSQNVLVSVFGGSLILGAFFMANDYITTPTTNSGKVIFGIGCGVLTFIINMIFSGFDGVLISVLIMNLLLAVYNRLNLGKYKEKAIEKAIRFFKNAFKKIKKK